jgi:hypothetical protein
MPKANHLTGQHEPLYTEKKFGKKPNISYIDQFDAIKVTIVDAPTVEQMRKLLPVFMYNSWQERPKFDGFTDEEKAEIEALCRGEKEDEDGRWGTAWIYDGEHNWEVEDNHVAILGPVKIDLVDADGYGDNAVLEENVEPYNEA